MVHFSLQWQDIYPNRTRTLNTGTSLEGVQNPCFPNLNSAESQNIVGCRPEPLGSLSFQTATACFSGVALRPTFTKLDYLVPQPFLLSSALTVIHTGDKHGKAFVIQELFIKLILKYYKQGVVFIDCTNVFPAYELIETTVEQDAMIDPQLPIRAVQLSRAFNYHQATEAVVEYLEPLLRDGFYVHTDKTDETDKPILIRPKIVILAGMADLYLNQESSQYLRYDDRPEWFSIFELQQTLGHLKSLTLKYDLVSIITTTTAPQSRLKPLGGSFLTHSSTQLLKIYAEGNGLYGELIKHPFSGPKKILLSLIKKKHKAYASKQLTSFFFSKDRD